MPVYNVYVVYFPLICFPDLFLEGLFSDNGNREALST